MKLLTDYNRYIPDVEGMTLESWLCRLENDEIIEVTKVGKQATILYAKKANEIYLQTKEDE